jgi:hypothetical protein
VIRRIARPLRFGLLGVLLFAATSCGKAQIPGTGIHGLVVNVQGEPLPGVVVTLVDSEKQVLTNALGEYKLPVRTGDLTLQFMKSGYTSGSLTISGANMPSIMAKTVSLWCLPQSSGLFLFENFHYRRTTSFKPRAFVRPDGKVLYGISKLSGIEESQVPQPLLMCYKMPPYDAKLCKLSPIEAASPDSPAAMTKVWVDSQTLPLAMVPVDEPERVLWEVRLLQPLDPGIYAIHWGALDGYTSTDERVFVFAVASESGESSIPVEEPKEEPKKPAPKQKAVPDAAAPDAGVDDVPDEAPKENPTPAANPTAQ